MKTDVFSRFARKVAHAIGSPITFAIALAAVVVWAVSGHCSGAPAGARRES